MSAPAAASDARGSSPATPAEHVVVHRDPFAYCSHPNIVELAYGDRAIAFLETMRRGEVLHSPADPRFSTLLTRSSDQGRTWSTPAVVPSYDWYGVECPSLTRLANGDLLLFQWRWRWEPWPDGAGERTPGRYERPGYPWRRGNDGAYVHRSRDGGVTWTIGRRTETAPYPGAYTMRSAAEMEDGLLLLPVTDIPEWHRIYVLRSRDGGVTWDVGSRVADSPDRQFSEPCIVRAGERLVVLMREERTGFIHQSDSWDGGENWTPPRPTPMWGCPPHLLALGDGRLLCSYGHRQPPYGIRACLSEDGGETWDIAAERIVRDDLPNANLGYPSSITVGNGRVFTTYYGEVDGVTCIQGTYWSV